MITIKGKLIPYTVEEVIYKLQSETGLFKDINDVGTDLMVTCPKHSGGNENNPSCGVSKEEINRDGYIFDAGTVHCYSCGYKADLPTLVSDVLGLGSSTEGLNWLLKGYAYINPITNERPQIKLDLSRKTPTEIKPPIIHPDIVKNNLNKFLTSNRAMKYMNQRKISILTCVEFKLGYNPENDSIMMPVNDSKGNTIFYKERTIKRKIFLNQKGISKADYIFGLDKAIQNYKNNPNLKVWICESEIDALTVYQYGGTAIAIMGSHISNKQIELLNNSPIRHLIDGLDRDKAGRRGYRKLKENTIKYGFKHYRTNWSNIRISKTDINDITESEFNTLFNEEDNKIRRLV